MFKPENVSVTVEPPDGVYDNTRLFMVMVCVLAIFTVIVLRPAEAGLVGETQLMAASNPPTVNSYAPISGVVAERDAPVMSLVTPTAAPALFNNPLVGV